eukprot:TRINITY_DN742_c0_g1_i2.p1 TRINITY_DN742_c0_g1~~TRINITY_DN742_c0_g1_i2.p1  ORF type:complete len:404 (-),score=120.58 TRINITY_DN742_c0_g1_i2:29-1117(-)
MLLGDFLVLLRENYFAVHPIYWHRVAYLLLKTGINSLQYAKEKRAFGKLIEAASISPDNQPVFVLGHWRSGTTMLHNLLSENTDAFAFPNTFQCMNPHIFLAFEDSQQTITKYFIPATRPMDNMPLTLQSAQEDEFAIATLCTVSPQTGDVFPLRQDYYYKFLTFAGATPTQIKRWKDALMLFLKKLTVKYPSKRLLLKSPHHTARVALLLEMFPNAKFVHIHRDPFSVYQSTKHLINTLYPLSYLQPPRPADELDSMTIERYKSMYDAYFAQRSLIPPGNLAEVSYDALSRNPAQEIERIYRELSLPGFEKFKPKLDTYVAGLEGYRPNKHKPMSEATRQTIVSSCRRCFDEWGYSTALNL